MSFYSKMAATALKLLTKFGASVTLKRVAGETFDPISGVTVAGTDSSVATTGVLRTYPDKVIDGTRIMSGDRELVLSNEQVPQLSDYAVINSEQWSIVTIRTVKPDSSTAVVYFVQVRK